MRKSSCLRGKDHQLTYPSPRFHSCGLWRTLIHCWVTMLPPQPRQMQTTGVTSASVRPLRNSFLAGYFNQYIPNSHSLPQVLLLFTCVYHLYRRIYSTVLYFCKSVFLDHCPSQVIYFFSFAALSLCPCTYVCRSFVLCWFSALLSDMY